MKNALETMEERLRENLKDQSTCKDKYGLRILNARKHDYQILVQEARELRDGIKWLKENVYQSA